ncbi:MAG TPA: chromate efflux transporter [Burkholderiaceae bacterium]|nr:chromate efflux transporter [Burkholderiaceae bacterium]
MPAPSPVSSGAAAPEAPSFAQALRFWLKLGCVSFGGPAGQIALMHEELVVRRRWISERRFLHALNYCMVLPGPEAQQLATYLGWLLHRARGGIAAGALFVLPSLVLLIGLSWLYVSQGQQPLVAGVFAAIKPAVVAIVAQAAWRIGRRTLQGPVAWTLALAAFVASWWLAFPWIVLGAALAGAALGRLAPRALSPPARHAPGAAAHAAALIDDDTPPPPHARRDPRRTARVVALGCVLWVLPLLALVAWGGWSGVYTQMGWFFTQAALLGFGGAYAVLPFIMQGAVQHYAWLTTAQMIDGLALGETTPGPLIMIVAFVGFVAAWQLAPLGESHRLAAAVLAACVVTWFTFLPSFVFILAGGPLVESTRGALAFTAPLAAISAAVVGVILKLAVFLAVHVFWPQGLSAPTDATAWLIAVAALVALQWLGRSVIELVLAAAALGAVITLAGV